MSEAHWGFIVAAYAVSALVIGAMTLKIVIDYRQLKRALSRLAASNPARDDIA
jgi:heme exporter protein CcmD